MRFPSIWLWVAPLLLAASAVFGADFTRAEVESLLAAAPESPRPSFARRSLAGLRQVSRQRTGGSAAGAQEVATARARWRSGVMRTTFQASPTRCIPAMIRPEGSTSHQRRPW